MTLIQEKDLVKEITALNKSRKAVAAVAQITSQSKSDELLVREMRQAIRTKSDELSKVESAINALQGEQRKTQVAIVGKVDHAALSKEVTDLRNEMRKKRQAQGKVRVGVVL